MRIPLKKISAFLINLDRSHDRWVKCYQGLSKIIPRENLKRVSGIDGRNYIAENSEMNSTDNIHTTDSKNGEALSNTSDTNSNGPDWKEHVRLQLQREGVLGETHVLDPVRTALCLSHQRALHHFLNTNEPWGLIFEDDVRLGKALYQLNEALELKVPQDSDLLFLHDRTWSRGPSKDQADWRVVRGGFGLEAYLVNPSGARKMLAAFRPVIAECDIQLMTFMSGYADFEQKQEIWDRLKDEGCESFPSIQAYAPIKPYFQADHLVPSIKNTIINLE